MKALTPWFKKNLPVTQREGEYSLYSLQKEMNQLFHDFFREGDFSALAFSEDSFGDFSPRLDMHDSEKEFTVTVELPGMEEKDIQLKLAGDILTLSGEKHNEKVDDAKGHYKMERVYGSFSRSLLLPAEVQIEKCTASFKNGVLKVVLPKTRESEKTSKNIAITAS